ncbi:MAG: hypothetical protein ACK5UO_11540, partial [Microcystis sp.]
LPAANSSGFNCLSNSSAVLITSASLSIFASSNSSLSSVFTPSESGFLSCLSTISLSSVFPFSANFWLFVTCYGSIGGHKSTKSLSGKRFN